MTLDVARRLVLEAGHARAVVCPDDGGRLGSVTVDGQELLVTSDPAGPVYWGSFPMAPWAGRTAYGRFRFAGRDHELPLGMPPHAIHGVVFDRPWTIRAEAPDACELSIELDERWPFRGRVTQSITLTPDGLDLALALDAEEPMPAVLGWHPWFRRTLADGTPPVRLRFSPGTMLLRGPDGIPTGERVPPPAGPWDDAFTDLAEDPVLEWPGRLRLTLSSSCAWWVVYSMPRDAICVEPQSGPPDALNASPEVVVPERPLAHSMRWRWTRPG